MDVELDDEFTIADHDGPLHGGRVEALPGGHDRLQRRGVTSPSFGTTKGLIGLQLLRTDRPMTIGRATARADIAEPTYLGGWRMNVSAVCMRGPP